MTRQHRRILTAVLNFVLIALLPGMGITKPAVAAAPDFLFSLNYKGEFTTEFSPLIRDGGTLPWPGAAYGPFDESVKDCGEQTTPKRQLVLVSGRVQPLARPLQTDSACQRHAVFGTIYGRFCCGWQRDFPQQEIGGGVQKCT